jgi:hypothetical protein
MAFNEGIFDEVIFDEMIFDEQSNPLTVCGRKVNNLMNETLIETLFEKFSPSFYANTRLN